jgi:hypothetical protein
MEYHEAAEAMGRRRLMQASGGNKSAAGEEAVGRQRRMGRCQGGTSWSHVRRGSGEEALLDLDLEGFLE